MSCLSWNCRGLGNPGTIQELANIVRVKAPLAVFLMETWLNEEYLEKVRCYLHFSSKLVVQSTNKGGGLVLFWNDDFNVSIKSYSNSHIDAIIKDGTEEAWRLTGVYGAPETHRREETWTLLRHLDRMFQLPWCCIGDFNEIVKMEEMKGRLARPDRQMRGFRSVLDDCGLVDLRYRGFPFTSCNNRDPPYTTWVRLDRAVANMDWLHLFSKARVEHVDVAKSDHKCLWLQCSHRHTRGTKEDHSNLKKLGCLMWGAKQLLRKLGRVLNGVQGCSRFGINSRSAKDSWEIGVGRVSGVLNNKWKW